MITLTDDERALLHKCRGHIDDIVVDPKYGSSGLRSSRASGGGHGFDYKVTNTSLQGEWCTYEVVERLPDGSPKYLRFNEPHLEVEISFTRLERWAKSLPADLLARVATCTRDELAAIVHEAIDLSADVVQLDMFPELPAVVA